MGGGGRGGVCVDVCAGASDLRPFSCAFLPWSKSAASLKDTRRPAVPVERKRSASMSWQLAADRQSDSSTLIVISARVVWKGEVFMKL